MNSKVLYAFIGGALLASGIVYLAVNPEAERGTADRITPIYVDPAQPQPVRTQQASVRTEQASTPVNLERTERTASDEITAPLVIENTPEKPSALSPRREEKAPRQVRELNPRRVPELNRTAVREQPVVHPVPTIVAQAQPPAPSFTPAAPTPAVVPPVSSPVGPLPAAPETPKVAESSPLPPPAPVQSGAEASLPPPVAESPRPEAPQPHTATIASGTVLSVRIGETLSSERNQVGDSFMATLDQPLIANGFVIAERGARCQGRVVHVDSSGRVRGVAELGIELTQIATSDGQHVHIRTAAFDRDAQATHREDAEKVGGGAALGAVIGAIAGGGKGAGIGALVGGAAGAGSVMMTRGRAAVIPVETRVSFRLADTLRLTEHL